MKRKIIFILMVMLIILGINSDVYSSEPKQERFPWNGGGLVIGVNSKASMTFNIYNKNIQDAYIQLIFTQGFDKITDLSYLYLYLNGHRVASVLLNDTQLQLYTLRVKLPIEYIELGKNDMVVAMSRIPNHNGAIKTGYYNYLVLDKKTSIYVNYK